jgi:hypothetical protein
VSVYANARSSAFHVVCTTRLRATCEFDKNHVRASAFESFPRTILYAVFNEPL